MNRIVFLFLALLLAVVPADARPVLGDAYRSGVVGLESPPSLLAVLTGDAPAGAPVASDVVMMQARRSYDSAKRQYRIGLYLAAAGVATAGGGLLVGFVIATVANNPWFGLGVVVVSAAGGAGLLYAGAILTTVGAWRATSAVNRGLQLGLGHELGIGSIVSLSSGVLVPFVGVIPALVFNHFQMRKVRLALERLGLADVQVMPMRNGMALAFRF